MLSTGKRQTAYATNHAALRDLPLLGRRFHWRGKSPMPTGAYARQRLPVAVRLWSKVAAVAGACWEWTGGLSLGGRYGSIQSDDGHYRPVHRVAYELLVGPVPKGLELDHLCRNTRCVNPNHLE